MLRGPLLSFRFLGSSKACVLRAIPRPVGGRTSRRFESFFLLKQTAFFVPSCQVYSAVRMTRPSSLQLSRHVFPGPELPQSVQISIATGLAFVENFNKVSTFTDTLQKWSSVNPGDAVQRLDIAKSDEKQVLDHVNSLCDAIAEVVKNNETISVLGVSEDRHADLGDRVIDDTPFQILMSRVLAVNRSGCTSVYAHPAVGKSIASLRALPAGRASKNYTVLLDGAFRRELQRFFRVTSFDGVGAVAELVFQQLKRAGVSMNMVLDNCIEQEPKVEQWQNALRALLKAAHPYGHHIVVVAQSQAIAKQIGALNAPRSRLHPEQEAAPKYRWGEEQAREHLRHLLEARSIPPEDIAADQFLSSCSVPDTYGGWMPLDMSNYLDLGEKPLGRALVRSL